MARTAVPITLIPRFTTFAGDTSYATDAIDVTAYDIAKVAVWRGPMPASTQVNLKLEGSLDAVDWGTLAEGDPGESTELVHPIQFTLPLFRVSVVLSATAGAYPIAAVYAVSTMVRR